MWQHATRAAQPTCRPYRSCAPREDTSPLWYVLAVGIVLGAAGLGSHGRGAGGTKTAA